MRVTWGATGTPRQVIAVIAEQAKAARQAHPDAGAVIVSARDALSAWANSEPADAMVQVSASIALSVTHVPTEPPPAVSMVVDDGEGDEVMEFVTPAEPVAPKRVRRVG